MDLDYGTALALLRAGSPAHIVAPLAAAARPLGATDLAVYVTDLARVVLQPLPDGTGFGGDVVVEEPVAHSPAGAALQAGRLSSERVDGGWRAWVPIDDHGERLGVLSLTTANKPDAEIVSALTDLGLLAALVIRSAARYTDIVRVRQHGQPTSLSASLQWDLLPPVAARSDCATVAGLVEPAYDVGGDVFDHALAPRWLDLAIFDGMGHGSGSSLLSMLGVGAYRHARRQGATVTEMHAAVDDAIAVLHERTAFATGIISRLHLESGRLERTNAGHPLPLLVRGSTVTELDCAVSLPFGLGDGCADAAVEDLQPGDHVLFYTDGVIEARSEHGIEYGLDRLAEALLRAVAAGLPPTGVVNAVLQAARSYQHGHLQDDATAVVLHWTGPLRHT
jgi:serine phosphatase RsbU (regulator of sigma subunit)